MIVEKAESVHCSDQDLIALLYCGDLGLHVKGCEVCQTRLTALQLNREQIEHDQLSTVDISSDRLSTQRRLIYSRLEQPASFWFNLSAPKWISAAATAIILGGSLFFYQHEQHIVTQEDTISDVELAREVSTQSRTVEALPAEPLEGLFE